MLCMVFMFITVACIVICLVYYHIGCRGDKQKKLVTSNLICALASAFFDWLGSTGGFIDPVFSANYYPFLVLNLMLIFVFLYRFLTNICGLGNKWKTLFLHFGIPLLIVAGLMVWSATVPFGLRVYFLSEKTAPVPEGYAPFAFFYRNISLIFYLYFIIYACKAWRIIQQYKKVIGNFSSDAERTRLHWAKFLWWTVVLMVPAPLFVTFPQFSNPYTDLLALVCFFTLSMGEIVVVYNLAKGNYVLYVPEKTVEVQRSKSGMAKEEQLIEVIPVTRKKLETYLREKKPYLNPKLLITDVASSLLTNRTYLSNFINDEYKMNFSYFINRYRLEEVERLKKMPENKDCAINDLILMAGFNTYRSYLRVKKERETQLQAEKRA
ncbi:MAG: hypothetical protein LBL81_04805 [Tannerella sp.]|nr:hypothetical protein [Tannerella sp.]